MGSNIVRNLGIRYISKIRIKFCIKNISKSAPGNCPRHVLNWYFKYPWSHESVRIHGTDSDLFSELWKVSCNFDLTPLLERQIHSEPRDSANLSSARRSLAIIKALRLPSIHVGLSSRLLCPSPRPPRMGITLWRPALAQWQRWVWCQIWKR